MPGGHELTLWKDRRGSHVRYFAECDRDTVAWAVARGSDENLDRLEADPDREGRLYDSAVAEHLSRCR